jgi:hypothetical protein
MKNGEKRGACRTQASAKVSRDRQQTLWRCRQRLRRNRGGEFHLWAPNLRAMAAFGVKRQRCLLSRNSNLSLENRDGEGFRMPCGVRKPLMQEPAAYSRPLFQTFTVEQQNPESSRRQGERYAIPPAA